MTTSREPFNRRWETREVNNLVDRTTRCSSRTTNRWTNREWCKTTKWTSRDKGRTCRTTRWTRCNNSRECSKTNRCKDLRLGSLTSRPRATRITVLGHSNNNSNSNSNSSREHQTLETCSETHLERTESAGRKDFVYDLEIICLNYQYLLRYTYLLTYHY